MSGSAPVGGWPKSMRAIRRRGGSGGAAQWGQAQPGRSLGSRPKGRSLAVPRTQHQLRDAGDSPYVALPSKVSSRNGTLRRTRYPQETGVAEGRQAASRHCQSSTGRLATRENSPVLCVTTVAPLTSAMAAIMRSLPPILRPRRSRSARIWPYACAAASSKSSDGKGAKPIRPERRCGRDRYSCMHR